MYRALFQNILFPFYETGIKRRNTLRYLKRLQENQWLSTEELLVKQWQELEKLLAHAYSQSPYYRELFDKLGLHPNDIKSHEDLRKIPICSRQDILEHKDRMIADNFRSKVMHKGTGGSSGIPMQFALDTNSYEWRTAVTQRGYGWAGCEAGQHTLYLWGTDIAPTPWRKLKTDLYHRAFNRKMFNCFELTETEMHRCLNYINSRKPTGIVAFTTAIYNFARFIEDNGLSCHPVKSVVTGAEKLYPHQREVIERALHTRVFNTYGCREVMLIAAECEEHQGLHVSVDNLLVEVINGDEPAQPGERGDIVITDLHNYGMPFIRYRNGDVVIQGEGSCPCGRGLPLIQDIDGRRMDEIVAVNGKVLSGGFFPHLLKEFPEVKKYQVVQKARDQLHIKLVAAERLAEPRQDFCFSEIRKVTGEEMQIELHYVDEIPLSASGKYRVTISEL